MARAEVVGLDVTRVDFLVRSRYRGHEIIRYGGHETIR